jgi:ABC-type Fe3+/spermidine/putrescine transport system ATPase subunit
MPVLEAVSVHKIFGRRRVLDSVSVTLLEGSCTALLGKSGSGKTTLARILVGLDRAYSGKVLSQGISNPMIVPQDFSIWPSLTVRKNIDLGRHGPNPIRDSEVSSWLEVLGLSAIADQPAGKASYGEQQRTAIARALCFGADFLVLDEPFSNLDAHLRQEAAETIRSLCQSLGVTVLWITHDISEACQVGDFLAILEDGRITRHDTPEAVYTDPRSATAARLTGPINILTPPQWNELAEILGVYESGYGNASPQVGLRPEWLNAISSKNGNGLPVLRSRMVVPGYLATLRMPSGWTLEVLQNSASPEFANVQLELLHPPCALG